MKLTSMKGVQIINYTNKALFGYKNETIKSNAVTSIMQDVLTCNVFSVKKDYTKNSILTFLINIKNTGNEVIKNLTITDNLSLYEYNGKKLNQLSYIENSTLIFVNGEENRIKPKLNNELFFDNITIPEKGIVTIVYQTIVTKYAQLDASNKIESEITIKGEDVLKEIKLKYVINVENKADLKIDKRIEPIPIVNKGEIKIIYQLFNYGNVDVNPQDAGFFVDTFNPIIKNIKVELNRTNSLQNNYTYNQTTGLFQINKGIITVPKAKFIQTSEGDISVEPGMTEIIISGKL